ncbi:hypothetical protein CPB86DRAFT_425723 [Serendipita vermifera]|nr:hypothetical protein CPB86DRAFT_425723 [Serendipita vermifera]
MIVPLLNLSRTISNPNPVTESRWLTILMEHTDRMDRYVVDSMYVVLVRIQGYSPNNFPRRYQ